MERENKMGTMPVNRLIVTMSLPIIIAMLVQAFYNVVDSYFVSQLSGEALTAVGQAFSAQNLMIGMATGTGVGLNALLARSLGQKDVKRANRVACNGILIAAAFYLVVLLFGLFGTGLYFDGITASAQLDGALDLAKVREYGVQYLSVCCIYSFGVFGQIMFERIMQATGRTVWTMVTQGLGAIINIVLDPIFIFVLDMGVAGAAYATVLGQIVAMIVGVFVNHFVNREVRLGLKNFKPDFRIIGEICSIGIPSIIMVGIGSVMYYLMNIIIMRVSSIGATIFGVYFKLQSFVFMPVFGLNNGVVPIIGYNYGAGKRKRLTRTVLLSVIYACAFMLVGIIVMMTVPGALMGLFSLHGQGGELALRIISISFIFAGFNIAVGATFQALGKGSYSMIVSIARQLLVLLPVAWAFSLTGDVGMIWWAFPIAELASTVTSVLLYLHIYKTIIAKIPDDADARLPEPQET